MRTYFARLRAVSFCFCFLSHGDQEHALGASGEATSNEGGSPIRSFFLSPPQSLLLFTINLHNFTFSSSRVALRKKGRPLTV